MADQPVDVAGGSTTVEFDHAFYMPVPGDGKFSGAGSRISAVEVLDTDANGRPSGSSRSCEVPEHGNCTITIRPRRDDGSENPITIRGQSKGAQSVEIEFDVSAYGPHGGLKHHSPHHRIGEQFHIKDDLTGSETTCTTGPKEKFLIRVHVEV